MAGRQGLRLAALAGACLALACATARAPVSPKLEAAAKSGDALAVADALEALIAAGDDTPADREYAYQAVARHEEDTAAYGLARATVAGRLVQERGLLASNLVSEVEKWAMRSRELDPSFRDGAATRLLGTLWVLAPASLLEHGDSERGLQLLEGLVRKYPESALDHLRLAQAYLVLHDPAPAAPHLCFCLANESALRPDEQRLLHQLLGIAGTPECPASP